MKLLEKILLATDFSKSSVNLLDYGTGLAKTFQSQIILVHVLPDNIENEKVKLPLIQAAFTQLKYIRDKIISEGLETGEPVLEFGSPYDKINELPRRRAAGYRKGINVYLAAERRGINPIAIKKSKCRDLKDIILIVIP